MASTVSRFCFGTELRTALETPGDLNMVKLLLNVDACLNITNNDGDTALHVAARFDQNPEIVKALLERGADASKANRFGQTPLHQAVTKAENVEIVKTLLQHGACINAVNNKGDTPLHTALRFHGNLEIITMLLCQGADLTKTNRSGQIPLHVAIAKKRSLETIRELLHCRSNPCKSEELIETPLRQAAEAAKTPGTINHFMKREDYVNISDGMGNTSLNLAIIHGAQLETVKLLLQCGADVTDADVLDITPLHNAVMGVGESIEIVKLLLEYGADVNAENTVGCTPLYDAVEVEDNLEIVQELFKYKADPNKPNMIGETPLHRALLFRNEIFIELLKHGACVNTFNGEGNTPLHLAIVEGGGNPKVVKKLLEFGADVTEPNSHYRTALHEAVKKEANIEIVQLLLEHGAFVNVVDDSDSTPMDLADGIMTVKLLIKYYLIQDFEGDYRDLFSSKRYQEFKDNDTLKRFFEGCISEIDRMKSTIVNTSVSLYTLMITKTNAALYPTNEMARNVMDEDVRLSNYPVYNDMLSPNVKYAAERASLLAKFIPTCASVMNRELEKKKTVFLPDCVSVITEYLSNEDMSIFITAIQDSRLAIFPNHPATASKRLRPETGFEEASTNDCTKKARVE